MNVETGGWKYAAGFYCAKQKRRFEACWGHLGTRLEQVALRTPVSILAVLFEVGPWITVIFCITLQKLSMSKTNVIINEMYAWKNFDASA